MKREIMAEADIDAFASEVINNGGRDKGSISDPKPFTWTASAASIIEKVERGRVALRQLSG